MLLTRALIRVPLLSNGPKHVHLRCTCIGIQRVVCASGRTHNAFQGLFLRQRQDLFSNFFDELGLQADLTNSWHLAVDVMIAIDKSDAPDLGSHLDH